MGIGDSMRTWLTFPELFDFEAGKTATVRVIGSDLRHIPIQVLLRWLCLREGWHAEAFAKL